MLYTDSIRRTRLQTTHNSTDKSSTTSKQENPDHWQLVGDLLWVLVADWHSAPVVNGTNGINTDTTDIRVRAMKK